MDGSLAASPGMFAPPARDVDLDAGEPTELPVRSGQRARNRPRRRKRRIVFEFQSVRRYSPRGVPEARILRPGGAERERETKNRENGNPEVFA